MVVVVTILSAEQSPDCIKQYMALNSTIIQSWMWSTT